MRSLHKENGALCFFFFCLRILHTCKTPKEYVLVLILCAICRKCALLPALECFLLFSFGLKEQSTKTETIHLTLGN